MHSHPVGLDVWFFDRTLCLLPYFICANRKALARLRRCAGSPEPSLVACVISTIISWAGIFSQQLLFIYLTLTFRGEWGRRLYYSYFYAAYFLSTLYSRLLTTTENQRTSGPVNTHLTPGPGIYFNAFIYVYRPMAGADNPLGTNDDVNRKPLSLCSFVASFKMISLKSDFIHIFNDFIQSLGDKLLMSTESPYHFAHSLQV